jgi:hypothetical protein
LKPEKIDGISSSGVNRTPQICIHKPEARREKTR